MDWRDLNPRARLNLAQEILASLGGDLAAANKTEVGSAFVRINRTCSTSDSSFLSRIARDELFWRSKRRKFVDLEIYGEAAWSILLDLYINRVLGKNTSVTSACIASEVPPTTALRYIALLEAEGLVISTGAENDHRVRWLKLTPLAVSAVERYLVAKADYAEVIKHQGDCNPTTPKLAAAIAR